MNRLKALVYSIVGLCILGALFSAGQIQSLFEEMLVMLVAFILVVELVPQYIVGEERKRSKQEPE
jgi:DMSO/TMAO reductase YedYZ heme-binding membrane subunit